LLLLLERVDLVERHKQLIQPMDLLVEMVEIQHSEFSALAVDLEELQEPPQLQLEAREARDNLLEA
jgi:predicted SpoU family rRNA methylase